MVKVYIQIGPGCWQWEDTGGLPRASLCTIPKGMVLRALYCEW